MIVSPARRRLRACLYKPSATSTAEFLQYHQTIGKARLETSKCALSATAWGQLSIAMMMFIRDKADCCQAAIWISAFETAQLVS